MSFNTRIRNYIQTRLGRIQGNTFPVDDIDLFDIRKIQEGVLTVWPEWSPQGFINCIRTIQYLYDRHHQGNIYVIDIDDIISAESQIRLFGHVLHGWGEIFIIKEGIITDEFWGKDNLSGFKTTYESLFK